MVAQAQSSHSASKVLVPRVATQVRRYGRAAVQGFGTVTARWRPLPDFLIVGTKRSGSTSLFRYLETHRQIAPLFPTSRLPMMRENQKGVHYFDSNYHHGPSWYQGHFLTSSARRRHAQLAGEASPYYLFHPLAAQRASELLPRAKIIVMLREPVERTFSHWSEQTRNGVETLSFEAALAAEQHRVGDDQQRLLAGEIGRSFPHEQQSYAAQSHYWPSLQRWLGLYGRDAVLILRSEDFYQTTQLVFDQVTSFLDIEQQNLTNVEPWNAAPKSAVADAIRAQLVDRFAPDMAHLEREVGIGWE